MSVEEIHDYPAPEIGRRTYDNWVLRCAWGNATNHIRWRTVNEFIATHFQPTAPHRLAPPRLRQPIGAVSPG
jgi:hypothetical protein